MSKCIIKVERYKASAGYTKVILLPEIYQRVVNLSRITGKTIQDTVEILMNFAIDNVEIYSNDKKIDINL